ncbi:MAG: pantetheine-phosphate adenylyltransferase [Rhodothermales bacterium]|nr:pantetheine-phosphate adenylyltransferase [Rhodothermales bacterium]MBO6780394.1 pantetheine-phosphate adenylyltransferase [Rhodothermales bacterium]
MSSTEGRLGLYPGSFDPFTYGHLDIVDRASRLFDRIEVTVAINSSKKPLLSVDQRCRLIEECVTGYANVTVAPFEGLLVDYARQRDAAALIRGLRQVSDFDFEFRMAFANRRLHEGLETVFLMTSEEHALIAASVVREIHHWGGDISSFVPDPVLRALTNPPASRA